MTSTLVLWTSVSFLRSRRWARAKASRDALDTERGVDRDLGGDLVRRTDAERAAVAGVGTLGALADHHEVDISAALNLWAQGKVTPGRSGRAQVDVVVELKAQPQQQAALGMPGQVRVVGLAADGTEEDRVVLADLAEHGVRQHLAGRG